MAFLASAHLLVKNGIDGTVPVTERGRALRMVQPIPQDVTQCGVSVLHSVYPGLEEPLGAESARSIVFVVEVSAVTVPQTGYKWGRIM